MPKGWRVIERDGLPDNYRKFYLWRFKSFCNYVVAQRDKEFGGIKTDDGFYFPIEWLVAYHEIEPYKPEHWANQSS